MPQRHRVTEVNNILDVIARLCGYARRLYNVLEKKSIDSPCLCAELNVAFRAQHNVAKFLFLHSP